MVNSVARYLSLQTGQSAVGRALAVPESALVVRAIIPLYADRRLGTAAGYAPKHREKANQVWGRGLVRSVLSNQYSEKSLPFELSTEHFGTEH